jgi:hypothetical protein
MSSKISLLTTDATPDNVNDYLATYDASTGGNKKVAGQHVGMWQMNAATSNNSPADSTTYYFGAFPNTTLTTSAATKFLYIGRTGVIVAAYMLVLNSGTAGSAETSSIYLRLNNTTDTLLSNALTTNAQWATGVALSVAVTAGNYVEIKWVTPAWATNPTGLYINVQLFIA